MTAPADELIRAAKVTGQWGPALFAVLSAWRASRSPDIASALEALTEEALLADPAGIEGSSAAFQATWCARAEAPDVVTTGWLARTLLQRVPEKTRAYGVRRYAAFFQRLTLLRRCEPDPRIASALIEVLSEAPFGTWESDATFGPLVTALIAQGDVRSAAALEELLRSPRSPRDVVRAWLAAALPGAIVALKQLPSVPAPAWRAWVPAAPAPHAIEAKLLAQVVSAPEDERVRRVYSDWLLEQGNPRGEFIALQLGPTSAASTRRARALLAKHRAEWLGELDRVLVKTVFRRGFLAEATLGRNASTTPAVWERMPTDPRLSTIERLFKGKSSDALYGSFVLSPTMRGLREVDVPSARILEQLIGEPTPLPFTHLRFTGKLLSAGWLRRLSQAPSLSQVSGLTIAKSVGLDLESSTGLETWGAALSSRIRRLVVETSHPEEVLALKKRLPSIETLIARTSDGECELRGEVCTLRGSLCAERSVIGALPRSVKVLKEPAQTVG